MEREDETVSLRVFRELETRHAKLKKANDKLTAAVKDVVNDPMLDEECKKVLQEGLK